MRAIEHTLTMRGRDAIGGRPRPASVGSVLRYIAPVIRDAVRMGFLHSSRAVGKPLKALAAAWDVRFVGVSNGSDHHTRLHFEAPVFGEAAEDLFQQGTLWDDGPNKNDTAFDLVGDAIFDIAKSVRNSERFDVGLLGCFARFRGVFGKNLESIVIGGHRLPADNPPVIDESMTNAARLLVEETPAPKRVRVQGTLDMIRVSDHVFELLVRGGGRLRAVWVGGQVVSLADQLSRPVIIEGEAIFQPSGSLLRVDTDAIAPATKKDEFFSRLPTPGTRRLQGRLCRQRQVSSTGFNAIFGHWPGEETDEEIVSTLAEIG